MDEQRFREILDESITPLRQDIKDLKVDVNDLKKDVSTLKVSVLTLEQTVGSYADSYKQNQRNIERLDKRLYVVEDDLGIEPPEEHKIEYDSSELLPPPSR